MRDPFAAAAVASRRPAPRTAHVAVTGVGLITPLGSTLAAFDDALFGLRSAVRSHTVAIPRMPTFPMAVAPCEFDDGERSRSRLPLDRGTAMAMAAARAAFAAAGLGDCAVDGDRLGVYWGSGMAGTASFDATTRGLYADAQRVRPTTVLTTMPNAAAAEIGLHVGARGAALTYACACASSAVAIGEAMRAIRGGWIDIAIVGGHEAMLTPAALVSWHAMRVTAEPGDDPCTSCRPFAVGRTGFALGEGAGALVIESAAHAQARGAAVAWTLAGYATHCDGTHMTLPDPAGQVRTMRAALADAGLQPADIGYVNAHGTGTQAGDAAEATSVQAVFGSAVPVSSTKPLHGHLLGGGGAVELIVALRALTHGRLPAMASAGDVDPDIHLDLVRGVARPAPELRHAMSNSFAFGGTNAVLIASRTN